jgi:hypothetical protein
MPLDVFWRKHMDISTISETCCCADRLFDTQDKVSIIKICLIFAKLLNVFVGEKHIILVPFKSHYCKNTYRKYSDKFLSYELTPKNYNRKKGKAFPLQAYRTQRVLGG